MKQLINSPEKVVREAIEALVLCNSHLQRLDGFPDIKVVFDKHHDKQSKVAVISGGGSGHEPAHAGFVGRGMLSAAVCGEVFASPSAEAVLAAIRAVTGPPGCLVIIKNYTGDRLHFGMAVERAKAEGLQVEMVVVGEDVAIEEPGLAGRRGLAGTVLVHKAAGATAVRGGSLSEVAAAARAASSSLATLGVALKTCALPGKLPSDRLDGAADEIEIGLGIHGEPGAVRATMGSGVDALVERMLGMILASRHFPSPPPTLPSPNPSSNASSSSPLVPGERLVLLVNNLGATTALETGLVARAAVALLTGPRYQAIIERVYVGPLMTSLDMAGVSLTLQRLPAAGEPLNQALVLLDLPVGAPGWPWTSPCCPNPDSGAPAPVPKGPTDSSSELGPPRPSDDAVLSAEALLLEKALGSAARAVLDAAPMLDELDAKVGDGDCGSTLALGARAVLTDLPRYAVEDPAATARQVAALVRHAVGGSSGALYDVFFTAAARSLKGPQGGASLTTASRWAGALAEGTAAVARYGGAMVGCRTMLDALAPATEAATGADREGKGAVEVAEAAAVAAEAGAEATKAMAASAGRSSYVPKETLEATADPGAVGVGIWIRAVASALRS